MSSKPTNNSTGSQRRPPGTTPENHESLMVSLATDLAEKQLMEGTASAQVISHYLKLGSSRERLEQERLKYENELLQVKARMLDQQDEMAQIAADAIAAMRSYQGGGPPQLEESEEDYLHG